MADVLQQWFLTFIAPRPIIATCYKPMNRI